MFESLNSSDFSDPHCCGYQSLFVFVQDGSTTVTSAYSDQNSYSKVISANLYRFGKVSFSKLMS